MDFWITLLPWFVNNLPNYGISHFGVHIYVNGSLLSDSARIFNDNVQFNRWRFEIWSVNAGHVKTKGAGTATKKLTNVPFVIFSYPRRGRWFIEKVSWIILSHYLHQLAKGVQVFLKTCHNSQENTCVGVSFY